MKPTIYIIPLLLLASCKPDPKINPAPTRKGQVRNLDEVKKPPPPSSGDPLKQLGSGD